MLTRSAKALGKGAHTKVTEATIKAATLTKRGGGAGAGGTPLGLPLRRGGGCGRCGRCSADRGPKRALPGPRLLQPEKPDNAPRRYSRRRRDRQDLASEPSRNGPG